MALLRRRRQPDLRIFFVTDVHGSNVCFRKFINGAKAYKAQVLILGGDLAGKRLAPMVRNGSGHWQGTLGHKTITMETERERSEFETAAGDAGLYTYQASQDEVTAISGDERVLEELMERLARERLMEWLDFAADRLDGTDVQLMMNCGNDDPFSLDAVIEAAGVASFLEGRLVPIGDTRVLASLGYANETPWACPRDVPEAELTRRMEAMMHGWHGNEEGLILNCHCPPFDSGLDTAQQLNADLSPVTVAGQPVVGPVGSTAVREAIERHRPSLSLHGHIHESRAATKIGPTLAVNPGSEYPEGVLRGAVVDLDQHGVTSYVLTAG